MAHTYRERKFEYVPAEKNIWAVFSAIVWFIDKNKYPPSIREIAKLADLNSTSYIRDCMKELETRGWIVRKGGQGVARDTVVTQEGKEVYAQSRARSGPATVVGQQMEIVSRRREEAVLD